jgi:hypothetical protein
MRVAKWVLLREHVLDFLGGFGICFGCCLGLFLSIRLRLLSFPLRATTFVLKIIVLLLNFERFLRWLLGSSLLVLRKSEIDLCCI